MSISPADLLEVLKGYPFLAPYSLALACRDETAGGEAKVEPCGSIGDNSLCQELCRERRNKAVSDVLGNGKPAVFRCPGGLLNFAVPFTDEQGRPCCLLGGGVREHAIAVSRFEALANASAPEGQALLERLEALPRASFEEVEEAAAETQRLLPTLLEKTLYHQALEKTTSRLQAVNEVAAEIDRAPDLAQMLTLLCDSLVVLFDLPAIAVILANEQGRNPVVARQLGFSLEPENVPAALESLLSRCTSGKPAMLRQEAASLFPGSGQTRATCFPLITAGVPLGLLFLFETDPHPRDLLLIELLAGRFSARLRRLRQEEASRRESNSSDRLLAMLSALSQGEDRAELYRNIVEMATDLVRAASGSLMLMDEAGEQLRVEASQGMCLSLARSMNVRVGSGIAGKVARNGFPLLVTDIERDSRVGIPNRPRFRTKSFISLPLKLRERVIGVLNLADKEEQEVFTEADLNLLTAFAAHVAILIERAADSERTRVLEQLSVTDPLTGLYNRRFLEKRLEEELSRSSRQKLDFTLLLLDLDNFKIYNDLCGHIAGDHALEKTAAVLRRSAREMDIVTRYGGEEFCLVLPGTTKKESVFVAERIRRSVENESFPREKELPLGRLTASLGIASFPADGETADALLDAADIALYQAKDQGRNRIVLFEPAMRELRENLG